MVLIEPNAASHIDVRLRPHAAAAPDLDAALPPVVTLAVRIVARDAQRLPPLPTTAVHGALGRSLRELACACRRHDCDVHDDRCTSVRLWEPRSTGRVASATAQQAAPLVVAPVTHALGWRALQLGVGDALELRSPARLVHDGQLRAEIDATALWRAITRRAEMLATLHGGGPLRLDPQPPFELVSRDTRLVPVERRSTTQHQRMTWPGLLGRVELAADGLPAVWPLLSFAAKVGIGKATTFGFGGLRLCPGGTP